ncbi:MAG TPA: ATP-binding protein [Gemmatimonadaceae bacterium]|nr:ATP-binding protein [Gemmatimonadaceae bacterium]
MKSFFSQQPLRRKLPLLISALVFVVVAVLSGFGYVQVERAMIAATGQRVTNAAQQVGGMLHESVLGLRRSTHMLASDSSVVAFLRGETARSHADVDHALRADLARTPQIVSRSLWAQGALRFTLQPNDGGRSGLPPLTPPESLPATSVRAWVGPLRVQQRVTVYDVVAPVIANGKTLGFLVETRRLGTGQSLQFVRELIGSGASFLLGNSDGSLWTDLVSAVTAPPPPPRLDAPWEYRRGDTTQLGATDAVPSAPWLVTIEIPRHIALAQARQFLYGASVIALLMIALGAIAAWGMSRSITGPLDDIARAAHGIAEGDYSRRAKVAAKNELGLLATSFDAMAAKVEAAARERENTLTLLDVVLASAPIGFALLDRELRYLRVNTALAQLNGTPAAEHIGRSVSELQPELGEERTELLHRVLEQGETLVDVELTRLAPRHGNADRQLRASIFPVVVAEGRPVGIGMFVAETTERRGLEAQLQQAQKMEAVGQLAGGIAHDFNNLLTVITSYGAMVMADLPRESPHATDVQEILNAANRASSLTRQLLAFSRRQVLQPHVLDLNALTGNLEKMLRRLLREDIQLVTRFDPKLALVNADAGQLEQVIVNLVVNARDAMPRGGRISIETSNVMLGEGYAPMHANAAPGPYVLLSVSDNGRGMDKATQAHIFEPFFTTKPVGQGTGLGLSTVYGIVKQSGGYVWVYSELDRGTTFKVYLPSVSDVPNAFEAERETVMQHEGGPERILLVEDEPNVRRIARRILERNGYTVLEASNGVEALRVMERRQEPIALVLTDLVMPEMGGRELASRLRIVSPTSRVLFMSGYTEDAVLRQSVMEPGSVFLDKPFTFETLIRKVREALAAA